jgi:hypothetical protein
MLLKIGKDKQVFKNIKFEINKYKYIIIKLLNKIKKIN